MRPGRPGRAAARAGPPRRGWLRRSRDLLPAAREDLSAGDYADISVESIAARAGVHKTTVYRRWGSKAEIIRQALIGAAAANIAVPDAGDVGEDLRALARAVQAVLSAPAGAALTSALIV